MKVAHVILAAVAVATAACQTNRPPPAEHEVKIDASNITEAQKAGYKIVDQNGEKLYCKKELQTGSHLRTTTSCLTAKQWEEVSKASREGVENTMRRSPPPVYK